MKKAKYFKFHISEKPSVMYMVCGNFYMIVRNYENNVEVDSDINSNTVNRILKDKELLPIEKGEFLLYLEQAHEIQRKKVF